MLKRIFFCLAVSGLLCGADYLGVKKIEKTQSIDNVVVTITVFQTSLPYSSLQRLVDEAFQIIQKQADKRNNYSELRIDVSHDLDEKEAYFFSKVLLFSRLSEGRLDPTDAPLINYWEEAKENLAIPDPAQITTILKNINFSALSLDELAKKLIIKMPGLRLNLKDEFLAYGVQEAAEFLKQNGVESAVLDAGYVIKLVGPPPEGESWRFGLEHPRELEEYMAILELQADQCIATIGDFDDFYLAGGKRYPLHIDVTTGFPPQNKVVSASAISRNALTSLLAAKALFILGPQKGYDLMEALNDADLHAVSVEEVNSNKFTLGGTEGAQTYLKDIRI